MPVTSLRVLLRVGDAEIIRPRFRQGAEVPMLVTVLDQDGQPVAGATVALAVVGLVTVPGLTTDAAGQASAVFDPVEVAAHVARATISAPILTVVERVFDVLASLEPAASSPPWVEASTGALTFPPGTPVTSQRIDQLPALGAPADDDILPAVRDGAGGTVTWSALRDAAGAAGSEAGAEAGAEAGGEAGGSAGATAGAVSGAASGASAGAEAGALAGAAAGATSGATAGAAAAEPYATAAAAAADTITASIANAGEHRETLAELTLAMAAAAAGEIGVVYAGLDEGVYRSDGAGGLTRVSDTQRQIEAEVASLYSAETVTGVDGGIVDDSGRFAWVKITPAGGLWLNGLEVRYDAETDIATLHGPDGGEILASRPTGGITIGELEIWTDPDRTDIAAAFADPAGYLSYTLDPSGESGGGEGSGDADTVFGADFIAAYDAAGLGKSALVAQEYQGNIAAPTAQINLIILYGQSYSEGAYSHPALTTSSLDNLMLGDSVHPTIEIDDVFGVIGSSVFNPLVGNVVDASGNVLNATDAGALAYNDPARGETPGTGLATMLRKAFLAHHGLASDSTRRFVLASCGVGGKSMASLEKGGTGNLYDRLTDYVTQAKAAADLAGLTIKVAAFVFIGGESDERALDGGYQDQATYTTHLADLIEDFVADCCVGILGQTDRPAVYLNQLGGTYARDVAGVALAQVAYAEATAGIYNFGPYYHIPDVSSHLPATGSQWLGNIAGKVVAKTLIRREGWKPLSPTVAVTRGRETLIQFHVPAPPLVFDTPYVGFTATDFGAKGFAASDTDGDTTVSAVEIVGDTVVKITHGRDVDAATLAITYAGEAVFSGVGCLRDSDATISADTYTYDSLAGQNTGENIAALIDRPYPQHNWCVRFSIAAPAG